jgi:uncharacterized membrane protein
MASQTPDSTADTPLPKGAFAWARNQFLTGLAVIIPVLVTYWILREGYLFLHDFGQPVLVGFAKQLNSLAGTQVIDPAGGGFKKLTQFVGILIPVVFLIGLGAMASNVIGARVMDWAEKIVARIPVISPIYRSLKQIIDAFRNMGGKQGFKRVVYVDYPVTGIWMLGFVTGQFFDKNKKLLMTSVFLPCAPSPMTGILVVVEPDKLSDAPMTVEDAMKMIFSGGLIGPETGTTTRVPLPPMPASVPAGETVYANLPTADDTNTQPVPAPLIASVSATGPTKEGLRQMMRGLQRRFVRTGWSLPRKQDG